MKFMWFWLITVASASLWEEWKKNHRRIYANEEDECFRYDIWSNNYAIIQAHNNLTNRTFEMGLNQFSDLTPKEFKDRMASCVVTPHSDFPSTICAQINAQPILSNKLFDLPPEIDWRTQGAVTSIKDQGDCGSCWAFSSVAALEGYWKVTNKTLLDLSEQQLVDCSKSEGNYGCEGGLMDQAFNYTRQKGACTQKSYPYNGTTQHCAASKCQSMIQTTGCANLWTGDVQTTEKVLQYMVTQQPVAVAVDAGSWQNYQSGVLDDSGCYFQLDHGVAVVGYSDNYWIVKNSWGTTWGENGYIRIVRGKNMCGIAELPSVPIG